MNEAVGLFILFTALAFGVIALCGFELCFKEKAIFFIGIETFFALLIIGVYLLMG